MAGTIRTYQKCPRCGTAFGSSKGISGPIFCKSGCMTQPTKFFIRIQESNFYRDKAGGEIRDFGKALAIIGGMRDEIKREVFDPDAYRKQSKTTFKAFWGRFKKGYTDKIGTADKLNAVEKHFSTLDDFQMREIRAFHVADWWTDLKEKGLSPKYRNDILQWLQRFFREAEAESIIDLPIKKWPKPEAVPEPEVEDWLTVEEQLLVLDALSSYDRPIFDFLFLTGVRVNEACGLQRTDINREKGLIYIKSTVKRDGTLGIVKNKKRRPISITPDIQDCLKRAGRVAGLKSTFVFLNRWGRRYSDDYLRDRLGVVCLKELGRTVKLKNSSRHSLGMHLAAMGYTMEQIKEVLNQSTTRVTQHYVTLQDDRYRDVYSRTKPVPSKKGTAEND